MAATPRPAGWKGGGEDFGFLRTFDGHIAADRVTSHSEEDNFGFANVRWGFDRANIGGDYPTGYDDSDTPDIHDRKR